MTFHRHLLCCYGYKLGDNATNIKKIKTKNNYTAELSERSLKPTIIYYEETYIKIVVSQSHTNPGKNKTQNILTMYPYMCICIHN